MFSFSTCLYCIRARKHTSAFHLLKDGHLEAWLNPGPADLAALYRIFDDKRHPFYEHKLAA
ncbi:hypothetical protein A9K69_19585 [Stenotrophomonas maltophilia]|nr:hypothetical protein [Stenotrophomonas maltophilia]OBU49539.1 hypothetical protein A9K69_19585 [Stenotrophomonas maltophilia]